MATGRSRGPASRPPRRPGGGRPRASTRGAATAAAPVPIRSGWRGRLTSAAKDRRTRRGAVLLSIVAFLMVLLGSTVAAYVGQQGDIAALQDKVAGQEQDVADAQGRAGPLARPGLRRAAGPAAAEVRQAGGAVVHRARRRAGDRHHRPRARAGRARRGAALVRARCGSPPAPPTCPGLAGDRTRRPAARRAGRPRRRLPPARAPGPGGRRGGPPLPVRRARRRAHRAPAARRHAVPDLVLRHLSSPHRRAVDPREPGRHARDERAARGATPTCASGIPRRTSTTSSAAPSSATCPRSPGVSAGGMPARVKCLHVLVAHSLAAGPGVNPLGDEALEMLDPWWQRHPCSADAPGADGAPVPTTTATDAGSAP